MNIRCKLFPYPVLSYFSDDYRNTAFITEIKVDKNIREIVFNFSAETDNKGLLELINSGKAEYVFHIECSQTFYRSIARSDRTEFSKRISENKLKGKVTICSFIVASEKLSSYINTEFNYEYGTTTFNIEKGGILAIGEEVSIDILKDPDDMTKNQSIFSIIRCDSNDDSGMRISLENDKIHLFLDNEDFCNYNFMIKTPEYIPLLHSSIIMPSLIYVFETLRNDGIEDYKDCRWFRIMDGTLKKAKLDLDKECLESNSSFELSQKILDYPLKRGLRSISNMEGSEDE